MWLRDASSSDVSNRNIDIFAVIDGIEVNLTLKDSVLKCPSPIGFPIAHYEEVAMATRNTAYKTRMGMNGIDVCGMNIEPAFQATAQRQQAS